MLVSCREADAERVIPCPTFSEFLPRFQMVAGGSKNLVASSGDVHGEFWNQIGSAPGAC